MSDTNGAKNRVNRLATNKTNGWDLNNTDDSICKVSGLAINRNNSWALTNINDGASGANNRARTIKD